MVFFFGKSDENTYQEGRALMQMYRVVPMMKRVNCTCSCFRLSLILLFQWWCWWSGC